MSACVFPCSLSRRIVGRKKCLLFLPKNGIETAKSIVCQRLILIAPPIKFRILYVFERRALTRWLMCGVLNEWIERLTTKISCTHFHVVNHQLSQLKGLFFRVEQQSLDFSFFQTQTRKYRSTAQKYTLSVADALRISFFSFSCNRSKRVHSSTSPFAYSSLGMKRENVRWNEQNSKTWNSCVE